MFNELLLASQSVQALMTLLKAAQGLSNYNEIVAAVSEVNAKLMQANTVALASQEKQSALAAKVDELEKECLRLKDWTADKERYRRKQVAPGVFAYVETGSVDSTESTHKYCCNCFDKTLQSTLQQSQEPQRMIGLVCPNGCPKLVFTHYLNS